MNSKSRVALFIPTYNSQSTVIRVLEGIPKAAAREFETIYVFDNQSADRTVEVVCDYARSHPELKIQIYRNERNYLLGGSTILALKTAIAANADYLVCMHSDGQANPEDLLQFIQHCRTDQFDFILGSRLLPESQTESYSKVRLWANYLFAKLQQPILGTAVFDLGAYLGFNLNTLKSLPFDRIPGDMAYHPNLILNLSRLAKQPFRFKEFPIRWGEVQTSHVNVGGYAVKHLARLLRLYFAKPNLSLDFGKDLRSHLVNFNDKR